MHVPFLVGGDQLAAWWGPGRVSFRVSAQVHTSGSGVTYQVWNTKGQRSLPPCATPLNPRIGVLVLHTFSTDAAVSLRGEASAGAVVSPREKDNVDAWSVHVGRPVLALLGCIPSGHRDHP